MNIAFIDSNASLDGVQRSLLDLASGLAARRWQPFAILGVDGPLRGAFEALGVPVAIIPFATRGERWRAIATLRAHFTRQDIRALYANSPESAYYGGIAMRLARGRVCWRLPATADLRPALYSRIIRRLCVRLHPATPEIGDRLRALVGGARVREMPMAIDLARYPAQKPPARKHGERPVVGMVGAWEPYHGEENLVKAIRLLHESGHDARLRFATLPGSLEDTRYRTMVQGAIKASGLADRIIVEGEIHDLGNFLAQCDIIAIPALRETSCRLVLEASAIGRPVIAARVPGLAECIRDGHTGLLVPPNDPRALADALALLLASPALRAEMARQARVHVEEHHGLEVALDAITEAFAGLS